MMKMRKSNNPGQTFGMDYSPITRADKVRSAAPPILPRSIPVWGLTLFFVVIDFMTIRTMTNKILTASSGTVTGIGLAMALVLDAPMAVLGSIWAQCNAGLRRPRESWPIIGICSSAFVVIFTIYAALRISQRDILAGKATGFFALAAPAAESQSTLPVALFMAFLPLATSLASLGLGLALSHPLEERLTSLCRQQAALRARLADVKAAMAECGDLDAEIRQAEETEEALYRNFLHTIDAQAAQLKQKARLLFMAKAESADSITVLTGRAQALCRQEPGLLPDADASGAEELPLPRNHAA